VFALRLNRFESFAEYSVAGDATNVLSTLNTWAEIGNIDPTVVTQGDWLVAAGTIADDNDARVQTRIESSDSTIAGGDGTGGWQADTADKMPNAHADMQISWTVGSKNIDVDGRNTVAGTAEAEDVWAVGFSMKETGWATATNGLPADRTKMGATVWNNRIYVVGGLDDSAAVTSTVYVSPSLSAGGNIGSAWASSTAFNVAREGATAVAYANNLYLLGGDDKTNYLSDVQYTQINSDGTVDSWSYSASLPGKVSGAEGFAANGFMYLIGGRSASATCDSNTVVAPISANTTIASGNNPTGVGEWYETNVKYTGSRYGNAVSYYEGKAYVLGGGCGATLTYTGTNRVVQTTMQSQPQVAKYSRRIDTDTDVFPTKWLMNGLDNSTGAQWYMKYRTMNDTDGVATDCGSADMSTWGRETNYGIVTLGTPADYNPLDGSGTDIDCARHYYMSVTIDSTYAFGYPEDVTRGPTIADLSLFFTSDPSKRLRHGKTFTGGQQQPLDTPF
jgi:hypothetical protein